MVDRQQLELALNRELRVSSSLGDDSVRSSRHQISFAESSGERRGRAHGQGDGDPSDDPGSFHLIALQELEVPVAPGKTMAAGASQEQLTPESVAVAV